MGVRVRRLVAATAQGAGVLFVLYAVGALAGAGWALLLAGLGLVAYGVLLEAGWV